MTRTKSYKMKVLTVGAAITLFLGAGAANASGVGNGADDAAGQVRNSTDAAGPVCNVGQMTAKEARRSGEDRAKLAQRSG
jgi:hypothetical protein